MELASPPPVKGSLVDQAPIIPNSSLIRQLAGNCSVAQPRNVVVTHDPARTRLYINSRSTPPTTEANATLWTHGG